jgi:hypothetical protein
LLKWYVAARYVEKQPYEHRFITGISRRSRNGRAREARDAPQAGPD